MEGRDARWAECQKKREERLAAASQRSATSASQSFSPSDAPKQWKDRWDNLPPPPTLSSSVIGDHELRQRIPPDNIPPPTESSMESDDNDSSEKTQGENIPGSPEVKLIGHAPKDPEFKTTAWEQRKQNEKSELQPLMASHQDIITQTTAAATRFRLTLTQHLGMAASFINTSAGNVQDFVASPATTKRKWKKEQKRIGNEVKENWKQKWAGWPKIIQWDGKVMELLEDNNRVYQDVNAFILTVPGSRTPPMVIGAPTIDSGTDIS